MNVPSDPEPLDAWIESLKGNPPALQLPTWQERARERTHQTGTVEWTPHAVTGMALDSLAQASGADRRSGLLAGVLLVLHRTTGQTDLVLGVLDSGDWSPLRVDLSGNPSFRELLARTHAAWQALEPHAATPLDTILERLGTRASGLFQAVFVLRRPTDPAPSLPVGMDLLWDLREDGDSVRGSLCFDTGILDDTIVGRMAGHLDLLLAGAVQEPDQAIGGLPFLSEAERQQILVEWNDKVVEFPEDVCLHELFEQRVTETPDALAADFRGERLTYAALNARANQVARHLQTLGVGPEVLVGISVERSLEMVIGLMAIAKAGGAYVPMDPAYPQERLAYMIGDSKVPVLLTQSHLKSGLPPSEAKVVLLDQESVDAHDTGNLDTPVGPENLSYVIYTSGSTGAPKGVMLDHRGRVNNFLDFNRRFSVGAGDAVIALASLSFDMCAYDVFGTLAAGAAIALPDPAGMLEPSHWVERMNECHVTTWHTAPAMLKMLVDHLETQPENTPKGLRLVLLGGDWIPVNLPDRLRALKSDLQVISMGGATECSMDSTIFEIQEVHPLWKSIPYGEPMVNQRAYVLDANFQPLPIGASGELYLGGIGVGRGYFERPELTAERFLADPFVGGEARMYRTGDLARWMPDGNLELLGRMDNQVKIRGYRIELGEIESRLKKHPAVKEGVVVAKEDSSGEKRLVAYLVQDPEWRGNTADNSDLGEDQVGQWEQVYDTAYSAQAEDDAVEDPTFNIVSWDSSYTTEPIPAEEMKLWVDQTVERIQRGKPDRVLEIGCGMGLLLFRVAPSCSYYSGTDISTVALDYVARHKERLGLKQVELAQRWADNYEGVEEHSLDCIVLNSIILDFPGMDYLMTVIAGGVKAMRPGGTIFLGDVRGWPLERAYQTSVHLFQAADDVTAGQLGRRVDREIRQEREMVIDPHFFAWLKTRFPEIDKVQVQQKRGSFVNELNAYRYDVTLHLGPAEESLPEATWKDWSEDRLDLAKVSELLGDGGPELLCVRGIPNARVQRDVMAVDLLASSDEATSVTELRQSLDQRTAINPGVGPEDLWDLAEERGYHADVRPCEPLDRGGMDVAFLRKDSGPEPRVLFPDETGLTVDASKQATDFANDPLLGKLAVQLAPEVKKALAKELPDYMVPALYMALDDMPLSPNGKVDRKALPEPDAIRPAVEGAYLAPRDAVESLLADTWCEVLALDRVGVDDNFYHLGGHSLLAMQIGTRLNEVFPFTVPLRDIFEYSTVASLSGRLKELAAEDGIDAVEACELLQAMEGLSDEEIARQLETETD